jgi:signal transduction histidine kinase
MGARLGIRLQLTLAILFSVTIASFLLAGLVIYANDNLEHALYALHVDQELEEFAEHLEADPQTALRQSTAMQVYLRSREAEKPLPERFSRMAPGRYHDLIADGRFYHLAVQDVGRDRVYVAMDVTEFERKEARLERIILAGATLIPLAAIWVWLWLSYRLTRPLTELANAVARVDPRRRNVRLSGMFRGREIQSIAREFDRYMERLDGFVEREQEFTGAASHELRTPLTVIATACDLLVSTSGITDKQARTVARIERAAKDMMELITALLFLARDRSIELHDAGDPTCLARAAQQVVDDYRAVQRERNIEIQMALYGSDTVRAPASLVSIVLGNLLRNALAFAEARVAVAVSGLQVRINDDGPGIEPDLLDHVFERHVRGSKSRGSGLGLYLVKHICERYGWAVTLESHEDKGTVAAVDFAHGRPDRGQPASGTGVQPYHPLPLVAGFRPARHRFRHGVKRPMACG